MRKPSPTEFDYSEISKDLTADLSAMLRSGEIADAPELYVKVAGIALCNDLSNIFVGNDMVLKSTGECYRGIGRLWRCNQRLCPSCLSNFSRRNRKRLRKSVEQRRLMTNEMRQLITLTIPELHASLQQTREVVHYAWTLFRKRKWFRETILAGSKSEEFTFSKSRYHYHLHLFAVTKYVMYAKLRSEWTECVEKAFAKFGFDFHACDDGKVVANCTRVYSLKKALHEVTKYITKAASWSEIPQDQLLEILRLKRWPRVFEMFGEFRKNDSESPALAEAENNADTEDYLDKENISDTTISVTTENLSQVIAGLIDSVIEVTNYRQKHLRFHHPAAKFVRKKGSFDYCVATLEHNCAQISAALEPQTEPIRFNWNGEGNTFQYL